MPERPLKSNIFNLKFSYKAQHSQYTAMNKSFSEQAVTQLLMADTMYDIHSSFSKRTQMAIDRMKDIVGRTNRKATPDRPHLADSIYGRVESGENFVDVKIWTDAPHAIFIEYGTSKMAAKPFFRPSILSSFGSVVGTAGLQLNNSLGYKGS